MLNLAGHFMYLGKFYRFKAAIVLLIAASTVTNAYSADSQEYHPSIVTLGGPSAGELDAGMAEQEIDLPIGQDNDISIRLNRMALKDLMPALSAVTGLQFTTDGKVNVMLDSFAYDGPASGVADALTRSMPLGYFNDSGALAIYSLDQSTTKTYSPDQFSLSRIKSRFAAFSTNAVPPLTASTLPGGLLRLEGPASLFAAIERDVTPPATPQPRDAPTLIKGGQVN
jgi:hypothetical protein